MRARENIVIVDVMQKRSGLFAVHKGAIVVKVYRAWQNGTIQQELRDKCGAPRGRDDGGELRLKTYVRANRYATVEQLTTQMIQGATNSVSQTTVQRTLLHLGLGSRRLVHALIPTAVRTLEFAF
ncbi:transposable element Tcb1 transposase [Trichonephila clavipes]|nr:transposable element Tcb1 transposase [Trichonephila clavipes]